MVHRTQLKQLAMQAEEAEQAADRAAALEAWRAALALLPTGTQQHVRVTAKVAALSAELTQAPAASAGHARVARGPRGKGGWFAGLAVAAALLAKSKWVLLFALSKAKLLLAGLGQAKTLLSMGATIGVYTMTHGWWFALGLVLSIYVHEMGHVAALRRYGIAASAPMFIPGLGAFVRLNQHPATPAEDARVGLAGPVWGAGAAVVCWGLGVGLDSRVLCAIAHVGAYINLFNLLPIWQLDGGRGFAALSRVQRGIAAGALWALGFLVGDAMLYLLAIAATARALARGNAPERGDSAMLGLYLLLAAGFTLMMMLVKA